MKYAMVIEKTGTGFSGYLPDLPRIGVAGETRAEVRKLLREAAEIYVAEMRAKGAQPPRPSARLGYVTAA
jgi:predicted RNase H-like HicB family nuclease